MYVPTQRYIYDFFIFCFVLGVFLALPRTDKNIRANWQPSLVGGHCIKKKIVFLGLQFGQMAKYGNLIDSSCLSLCLPIRPYVTATF